MNRLLILFVSVIVLLSLVGGCADKEEQMQARIHADSISVVGLKTALNNCQDDYQRALGEKNAALASLDSVLPQLETQKKALAAKDRAFKKQQQAAEAKYAHTVDSLTQQANVDAQDYQCKLQEAKSLNDSDAVEITSLKSQLISCDEMLAAARPWHAYYKQKADRGFFKRLVGAGKAKKPTTPDPW